ncbi:hypothetical protein [Methanobacterium alcaliphilum]|uniref:hypothetical protein n=1 Tax=Methanobacterium alcaliphilum TaxID=392018 RepID=UPI00200A65E8|nr:hypothetical protein [Methanobacterium alcaliphilum]MCK9151156.1 hypothetical protein [Methanobacterium alcaliphilum]
MELGLVNFQNNYEKKVLDYRDHTLATLMNISANDLKRHYAIVDLKPFSHILLNMHLGEEFSPLRFYSLDELEGDIYFFIENSADLEYANLFLKSKSKSMKKFFLEEYLKSIDFLPEEFFEPILRCPVALEWDGMTPLSGYSMIDLQILAVIPKDNDLVHKQFEAIGKKRLDQVKDLLFDNNMINKVSNSKYFFIINQIE